MSTLYGGGGNDSYGGSSGNDLLYGNAGNDSLSGGDGNDTLSGGLGNDSISGGLGTDILVGGQGSDTFYGGDGDDLVVGDGQWIDLNSYASSIFGLTTTLTVVNNSDGPFDLNFIDSSGIKQFVATIAAGATYSLSTKTSSNYVLTDRDGYFLDVIQGASNQTFTVNPPLQDLIYGGAGNDDIRGQFGNDTIFGDDGNDTIRGGTGQDSLSGGIGADRLYGDDGNDSIFGGAGDDYAELGSGNDTFGSWGTEDGNDTVYGGAGDDSLNGGLGNDQIWGDDGNDWITGSAGEDTLYGGGGSDFFAVTDDHNGDTIYGGETGVDYDRVGFANFTSTQGVSVTYTGAESGSYSFLGTTGQGSFSEIEEIAGTGYADIFNASAATSGVKIYAADGADSITGGSGSDSLFAGDGNDLLFGGAGNDSLSGESGNDSIEGGTGGDSIVGDSGDDTLSGGAGIDTLFGGAGADVFELTAADSGDQVADFDMTLVAGRTTDQLDVSDLTNPDGSPIRPWDVTITDDGAGSTRLGFPQGETITLSGVSPAQAMQPGALQSMGVPCFVRGSRILTPSGEVPIERLVVGDLVITRSGRAVPILWHGTRHVDVAQRGAAEHLRPIRILGGPSGRALKLSPQHGVFIGRANALGRAKHLAAFSSQAHVVIANRAVIYHHILLPQHSLIQAEGWWVESLYPGPMALAGLTVADQNAIARALGSPTSGAPVLDLCDQYGPRVVPVLSRKAVQKWLSLPGSTVRNPVAQGGPYLCKIDS